ncbi:DNA polymerase subunit delta-2 [Sodiomyces alkalinus F11]|uniref:DNA-directed DNA polymerase n=1 Tax=Sodiomyces alkalinus (strain CBS 110278 / VKM F-3762 / F11) TaxID=1314773 RepID=A0A3N2Q910_SODAK|nr:DNA polymerase subunit delta-2 [Sodiomyces alkalinus F11]ROT43230.1 DNA polymerase subunit delta-2 [Sodiomyces alkalinus F11]
MVTLEEVAGLLKKPSDIEKTQVSRAPSSYKPLDSFFLKKDRSYKQQFADTYFLRLVTIKPAVEKIAAETWSGTVIGGETAKKVDRVLDIRQGELCWVSGTVYMDMPLKPNILEDVSKDRWISAPITTDRYYSEDGQDQVLLEDDSGRVRLVGNVLKSVHLVTGCIIAVMGTENINGEIEVIDIKFPDLAPQPQRWTLTKPPTISGGGGHAKGKTQAWDEDEEMMDSPSPLKGNKGNKIAIVSGLCFSGTDPSYALELDLLHEYLLGEALDQNTQREELAKISRLIIAGNSISTTSATDNRTQVGGQSNGQQKPPAPSTKKYGYDSSSYNPLPSQLLDEFLSELLPCMPVTLLPGAQDPANASYPQQPIHVAMFPRSRSWCAPPSLAGPGSKAEAGWLDNSTNPWEAEVDGWRFLGTGGQNVDDVFKYVESEDRLGMMEAMCRWRCIAPTAPDTLWSYPFQDNDPFVMKTTPHVYFIGCQPEFSTKVIHGPEGQVVRLVTVPSFAETKELVLIDTETLEVSRVKIATS